MQSSPPGWQSIFWDRESQPKPSFVTGILGGGPGSRPNLLIVWKGNTGFEPSRTPLENPVFRQGTNYICYLMFGLRLEGKGSVFFNIQELRMYHLKMTIVQGQMYVSTRWAPTIVINVQWSYGAPINGLIDGFSWGYNPSYRSHFTELQLVMGPTLYKALPILWSVFYIKNCQQMSWKRYGYEYTPLNREFLMAEDLTKNSLLTCKKEIWHGTNSILKFGKEFKFDLAPIDLKEEAFQIVNVP